LVAHARAQGLRTYAYTVNRVPELRRLAQLGVDAVISNRPAWARDWLRDGQGDGQGDGQRDWLRADG
jgi:glycerophosphoryl diester phosphodiesterase